MNNNYLKKHLGIIIGVLGMILVIIGTFLPPQLTQKVLFIAGAVLLLISSTLEKNSFFIVLEIIVLIGTLVAFTSMSIMAKVAFPFTASIIAIIYFAKRGMLRDYVNIIGCVGLLFLATGFAVSNPIIYLLGGTTLTVYSGFSYHRGANIALIFAICNAIFTVTSAISLVS